MEALAKQNLFCFEKMVIRISVLIVAAAIFSAQNVLLKAYANVETLKGYIVETAMLKEPSDALFLLHESWQKELKQKYKNANIKKVENGVVYVRLNKTIGNRHIKINVGEINRNINKNLEIAPQLASNGLHSKSKIGSIAAHAQTLLAVNGTYFKQDTGTPLGALMIDNEIITGPIYERVGFGIGENEFKTSRLSFRGILKVKSEEIKIDNINQPRMLFSQVLIYTNKWGVKSPVMKSKCRQIAIKNNKVTAISDYPLIIPENGYVISAPKEKVGLIKLGQKVSVDYSIVPKWENINHIISGGPYLLKDGSKFIDVAEEKLNGVTGRNPRTAIGYTQDNVMIMVTVDGRKEGVSGVTLSELADIMKNLGCYEAINLDGGSSTVMFVDGITYSGSNLSSVRISNALTVKIK